MLRQLHWLPVEARIKYKIATLCFKCNAGLAPSYLAELVQIHKPNRSLRSSKQALLTVPQRTIKKTSERAFGHWAPVVWNSLPEYLRKTNSLEKFKSGLKTCLFEAFLKDC